MFKDAIDDPSASIDGDETPTIDDIPGSITLWEATPRPSNSSEVNKNSLLFLIMIIIISYYYIIINIYSISSIINSQHLQCR